MVIIPVGIYLPKVNNRNIRTRCELCSKLTIITPERCQWRRSGVFIFNFEHISRQWGRSDVFILKFERISCLVLVFLLLTLNM